jgi:hypothetical protein
VRSTSPAKRLPAQPLVGSPVRMGTAALDNPRAGAGAGDLRHTDPQEARGDGRDASACLVADDGQRPADVDGHRPDDTGVGDSARCPRH